MSTKKSYGDYIEDILTAIRAVQEFTRNLTFNTFQNNDLVSSAVCRKFEIIGEACNRIPSDIQKTFSEIPWKEMVGMRNIIIHNYDNIRDEILWEAIHTDFPKVIQPLQKMLQELDTESKI